jgi:hypothetical protein
VSVWEEGVAGGKEFALDRVFQPACSQGDFYQEHRALLNSVLDGQAVTVLGYGHGREALMVFLPKLVAVDDAGQIEVEVAAAKAAGRALFLVVGHQNFNRAMLPTGFAVFEGGKRFEEVARLGGIEAENGYWVYRMRE